MSHSIRRRVQAVVELLDTEEQYVVKLRKFAEVFFVAMREAQTQVGWLVGWCPYYEIFHFCKKNPTIKIHIFQKKSATIHTFCKIL